VTAPLRVRAGALHELLDQVSAENTSAAVRALALIGAAEIGLNLGGCGREIALALLAEDLHPAARVALGRLAQGERRTGVGHSTYDRPTSVLPALIDEESVELAGDDPFAGVGIEV
jgi:hypothetical protein